METVTKENLDEAIFAELLGESVKHLEKDFYDRKFYFSYSSLNKLLWSPAVFHQMYVLGMKEEKTDAHLVQGKLIHLFLLEPEKFDEQFLITPSSLPTGNLRVVVDRVYRHYEELSRNGDTREQLEEFDQAILDVMRDINYFQSLKTDQQRLDKVLCTEAIQYWNFLKVKGGKTLVDEETIKFCQNAVELIRTNKEVCRLIGCDVSEFDNREVINETFLQADLAQKVYGLKGIIDNLVIDHDSKTIYINDIKTTSKDLKDFPESIEYYSYWMQAVMYMILVGFAYDHLISGPDPYAVKFHFVVIDRTYQTYAFPVSEATSKVWLKRFGETLEKAEWHYVNRNYDLPYDFATGSVVL